MKYHTLLLGILLFVTGCTFYNNYTPEGQEEYRTGSEGVVLSFLTDPLVFYDHQYLNLQLMLQNKGAYNSPEGKIVISGYDPSIVKISSDPLELPDDFFGKSYIAPEGATYFLTVEEDAPVSLNLGESYESTLQASVCYTYESIATPTVCLLYYPEDTNICRQDPILLSSQGGPVAVTEVKQQYMQDQVRFTALIQHVGDGTIVNPYDTEAYDACPFGLKRDDINHVNVKMEINSLGEPKCVPGNGYVTINENGQGIIICTFTLREQKTYTTPLRITLDYSYLSLIEGDFAIYESSSETDRETVGTSLGYEDLNSGNYGSSCYCSDANMKTWGGCVCIIVNGQSYYCSEGQTDIPVSGNIGDIIEYQVVGSSTVHKCGDSSNPQTDCPFTGKTSVSSGKVLSIYGTVDDGRTVSERCKLVIQ